VKLVKSDCLSVAEQFAPIDDIFAAYNTHDLERIEGDYGQDWKCNWKLAWDNYAENYHIPSGHPGLQRMMEVGEEGGELPTGIGWGLFRLRERTSNNSDEARYQSIIHTADDRMDDPVKRTLINLSMHYNMGIEVSGECLWVFQILPTGVDSCEIRFTLFGRKNRSGFEQELIDLNYKIMNQVNSEDKFLVERIQRGVNTQGYQPGPLSYQESTLALNHQRIREIFPVAGLPRAPKWGTLADMNEEMKKD